MRPVGVSTGALAKGDFVAALRALHGSGIDAVELSALRTPELAPLVEALPALDLSQYRYVSVHAPADFTRTEEDRVTTALQPVAALGFPIVLHPDAIHRFDLWAKLGRSVCIENMDRRKATGRTAKELEKLFAALPEAELCLDVAHARQVDPSMTETYLILRAFRSRLRQLHVSEIDAESRHQQMSAAATEAYKEIASLIPPETPIILEGATALTSIQDECRRVTLAFGRDSGVVVTPCERSYV